MEQDNKQNKKLAIVIANYNGRKDTLECLESLGRSLYKDFFVVLVDDGSDNRKLAIDNTIESYGIDLEVVELKNNRGFAAANNVGIKRALEQGPEYIMLLNNDTVTEPDMLDGLMEQAAPKKVVAPLILRYDDRQLIWAAGLNYVPEFMIYSNGFADKDISAIKDQPGKCEAVSFCACIIPSGAFDEAGYLDEAFYMYDEDVDYCMRLKKAGYDFEYIKKAVVYHKAGAAGVGQRYSGLYYGLRNESYIRARYLENGEAYNNRLLAENSKRLRLKGLLKREYTQEYWVVQALSDWKKNISGKKNFEGLDAYDIYVCQTSYHLLVTMIKAMNSKRFTKLILCAGKLFDDQMVERIKESGIFEEVINYRDIDEYDRELDYSAPLLKRHDDLQRQLDKKVVWQHKEGYEYYLYSDICIMGKWLNSYKIKYHLIEDGMDTFTMPAFKALNYKENPLKKIIRRRIGAGFYCFGESLYYKSIEVNSRDGLLLKSNKIKVVPKRDLFGNLTKNQKKKLLEIYLSSEGLRGMIDLLLESSGACKSLLLTQPFAADKMMSYKMQGRLYQDVVRDQVKYDLVIKPHPRDNFDYSAIFPDAVIIKENVVPVEAFDFMEGICFKQAVTVCSTSINGILGCDEKISLGLGYLRKYFLEDKDFEQTWQFAKDMAEHAKYKGKVM